MIQQIDCTGCSKEALPQIYSSSTANKNLGPSVNVSANDKPEVIFDAYANQNEKEKYMQDAAEKLQPYVELLEPTNSDLADDFSRSLSEKVYEAAQEKPLDYNSAMDYFNSSFLKKGLTEAKGIVTEYARTAYDLEDVSNARCNVHKQIKKYGLQDFVDSKRPWIQKELSLEGKLNRQYLKAEDVAGTLKSVLYDHASKIHPNEYSRLDDNINELAPMLANDLNNSVVTTRYDKLEEIFKGIEETNIHKAKAQFERQFISNTLTEAGGDKKKAAQYLGVSLRTVNRKIRQLGIDEMRNKLTRDIKEQKAKTVEDPQMAKAIDMASLLRDLKERENAKNVN